MVYVHMCTHTVRSAGQRDDAVAAEALVLRAREDEQQVPAAPPEAERGQRGCRT